MGLRTVQLGFNYDTLVDEIADRFLSFGLWVNWDSFDFVHLINSGAAFATVLLAGG